MALTDEQKSLLNSDLPAECVKQRRGPGGMTLDYVEGWWVIDRLNTLLGPDGWSDRLTDVCRVCEYEQDGRWHVSYRATCEIVITGGDNFADICSREDVGVGSGTDRDRKQAHESALKEAATDAFKRAARKLGRSMGLALYDKSREHVISSVDVAAYRERIAEATSRSELKRIATQLGAAADGLKASDARKLKAEYTKRMDELQ